MADTSIPSRDGTTSGQTAGKSTRRAKAHDLEKRGRDIEPIAPLPSAVKEPLWINVGRKERLASIAGGAALFAFGVMRRDWAGLALAGAGAGVALRGITGHCPLYGSLEVNTAAGDSRETHGVHVEEAITIDRSREDLYAFWRDFENHALLSDYLVSVKLTNPTTSHWIARGPADKLLEWDAEVINDRPNELISWQTLPGADVEHAGTVRFRPAPGGRGTQVHVTMQYYPPAGTLGAGAAMLLHREPSIQAADTLRRLKRLKETGDILKVDGQPHGRSIARAALNPKS
jgi:uncharacterized membrane protein